MSDVEQLRATQCEVERAADALSVAVDRLVTNDAMPAEAVADITFAWNRLNQSLSTIRQTLDELTVPAAK